MKLLDMTGRGMFVAFLLGFGLIVSALPLNHSSADSHWITAWTAMPQLTESANLPSGVFVSNSLPNSGTG